MENVSKAVIIAGGIFIGVLIISLSVAMYSNMRDYFNSAMNAINANEISNFNSYFLLYENEIYGYDVYNIMGRIIDINSSLDTNRIIELNFNDPTIPCNISTFDVKEIKKYRNEIFYYTERFAKYSGDQKVKDYSFEYSFDPYGYIDLVIIDKIQ